MFDRVANGFQGNSKLALVAFSSVSLQKGMGTAAAAACLLSDRLRAVGGSTKKEVLRLWREGMLCKRGVFPIPVFQHACSFPGCLPVSLQAVFSSCSHGHRHSMVLSGYPWSVAGSLPVKLIFTYTVEGLEIISEKFDRLPPKESVLKVA